MTWSYRLCHLLIAVVSRSASCGQRMGALMKTTEALCHQSYGLCTCGRDTGRWGRWSQGPCKRWTRGQTEMAVMDTASWAERRLSRRISQAKAQKQEFSVCRDWQAGWLGWGKGKRKLKTKTGYRREFEWRLWNLRLTSLDYSTEVFLSSIAGALHLRIFFN